MKKLQQWLTRVTLCGLSLVVVPVAAYAQGSVDAGGLYYHLTQGYGNWQGAYVRGLWGRGSATTWNWELDHAREFGVTESYGVLGATHTFDPRWYGYVSVGASTATDIVPQTRGDVSLSYKALPDKRWVTTLGYTGITFRDGHRDSSAWLTEAAYLPHHWVAMAGQSWMVSNPGSVGAQRSFVALSYAKAGSSEWTLRYGWGTEAYLPISATAALVDFRSRTTSATWRQWLGRHWGSNLSVEDFRSPYYQQYGGTAGVFYDF